MVLCGLYAHGGEPSEFSRKGADSCLKCHDDPRIEGIFHTAHGGTDLPRSPFAALQCEACHGPAGIHAGRYRDEAERPPPPAFGPHVTSSAEEQNQRCLSCHNRHARTNWSDGAHADAQLLCSSCHSLHASPTESPLSAAASERCALCHADVAAQSLQRSGHPLRQGQMNCGDCHQVHGTALGERLLSRHDTRETCLSCHAEKRGPYLWEHAPAAEDCGLCHRPHGSQHAALLNTVKPMLCQSCHSQSDHPSQPYTTAGLPGGQSSAYLLSNSCSNCHSQVHGSNHPSGARLLR